MTTAVECYLGDVRCPRCDNHASRVREEFTQATRTEPMRSLGVYGYCTHCDVSFKVTA
jgi:hypothetical protein